jgi:hypothetical protein
MDKPPRHPIEYVSASDLRDVYNRMLSHYAKQEIELTSRIDRLGPVRPDGSRSTPERIRTPDGRTAAVVHYFLYPDGGIGASGRKDPKRVVFDGVDYRLNEVAHQD